MPLVALDVARTSGARSRVSLQPRAGGDRGVRVVAWEPNPANARRLAAAAAATEAAAAARGADVRVHVRARAASDAPRAAAPFFANAGGGNPVAISRGLHAFGAEYAGNDWRDYRDEPAGAAAAAVVGSDPAASKGAGQAAAADGAAGSRCRPRRWTTRSGARAASRPRLASRATPRAAANAAHRVREARHRGPRTRRTARHGTHVA